MGGGEGGVRRGGVREARQVGGKGAEEETIFCRGKGGRARLEVEVEVEVSRVCCSWYCNK